MNWLQKIVVSFTLLAGTSSLCLAGDVDYGRVIQQLDKATPADAARIVKESGLSTAPTESVRNAAQQLLEKSTPAEVQKLKDALDMSSILSGKRSDQIPVNVESLRDLKNSPIYADSGPKHQSNWFEEGFKRLEEWLRSLTLNPPKQNPRESQTGSMIPDFITGLVWIILGVVVCVALYYAFQFATSVSRKKRIKQTTLFSAEELENLTLDEWLAKADALIAEGNYKEAIRCLYVASLVRLQERNILQLRPYETNWEHFKRYRQSAFSENWDLRDPTAQFDQHWYGKQPARLEDAMKFKAHYNSLQESMAQGANVES